MNQDFKKPQPTKTEKILYEFAVQLDNLQKAIAVQQQMLYALLGVLEGQIEIPAVLKTFHNKLRIENIKMKAIAAEMEIIKQNEGAAKVEADKPKIILER